MGIHDRRGAPQMFPAPDSWVEAEQRRRVWWAIIILDRYVNLGGGNRPFVCSDAKPDDLLPMKEASWDTGEPEIIQPLAVSPDPTASAPPFARTCQASHLLSHVIRHLADTNSDAKFRYQRAIQLHRTLNALQLAIRLELLDMSNDDPEKKSSAALFPAIAICYSAQLTLYDNYVCTDADDTGGIGSQEQVEMQKIAMSAMRETCVAIHAFANMITSTVELGTLLIVSPLTLDCLYQAATIISTYMRQTGKSEFVQPLADITYAQKMLGKRWTVANEYLKALGVDGFSTD